MYYYEFLFWNLTLTIAPRNGYRNDRLANRNNQFHRRNISVLVVFPEISSLLVMLFLQHLHLSFSFSSSVHSRRRSIRVATAAPPKGEINCYTNELVCIIEWLHICFGFK